MKIAIILPQLEKPGGAERVVTNLANYWRQQNHQVIFIIFTGQNISYYKLDENVKIYSLVKKINISFPIIKQLLLIIKVITGLLRLRKLIKTYKPKIAIGVDIKANLALSFASLCINNIVNIATEHRHPPTVPVSKWLLKIARLFCSRMQVVIALTDGSKNWFEQNTSFRHVVLIPNPVIYPLPINKPITMPSSIINIKNKTLLAVGRLSAEKGFDLIIPIFKQLVKQHDNWQLVILGEGDQRLVLEQQINKLGLQNKIYLPGAVGNLADWYLVADLFVFPSRYEGFGCALVEAMAYGLPVVSFDCKVGPRDIITHNLDGLLIEDGNIYELTKSLDMLMSNENLRYQLSIKAREIRKRFSIEKTGKIWQNLFDKLETGKLISSINAKSLNKL